MLDIKTTDNMLDKSFHEIIIESIGTGILVTDLEGKLIIFNKAAEEMWAYPKEEALGNPFFNCIAELDRPRMEKTFFYVVRTGRSLQASEAIMGNRAGKTLYINAHASLFQDTTGNKMGVVMLTEDITEKKKLEEEVQRADRLAALGQLSMGLSHEIRTPLATIKALTTLVKTDTLVDESLRKQLNMVINEVNRLDSLCRQLLNFAGKSDLHVEKISIKDMLDRVLFMGRLNHLEIPVKIKEDIQPDLPEISGDKEMLTHAFINLLINAMEAVNDSGNKGVVTIKAFRDGKWNVIKVSDTGIGIRPGEYVKIFDPFYTTKENGTGLGLSMVHTIITKHGGHINVESREGIGTAFTIKLPVEG